MTSKFLKYYTYNVYKKLIIKPKGELSPRSYPIQFGSKSTGKLSPRSYPIPFGSNIERKTVSTIISHFLWFKNRKEYCQHDHIPFNLVQNRKENCHHDHIPFNLVQNLKEYCHHDHITFNLKGNGNIVFSVHRTQCTRCLQNSIPHSKKKFDYIF